jgi:hypothetical protein
MSSRDFDFLTLRNLTAYNNNNSPVTDNYILTVSSYGRGKWTNTLNLSSINTNIIFFILI